MLRAPEEVCLVAVAGSGQVVGFAEVALRSVADGCETHPVGYLEGWFVARTLRRSGVGRLLVEAAEDWARSRGCAEFASDVETDNPGSFKAHLRLGFEQVSRVVTFRKSLKAPGRRR